MKKLSIMLTAIGLTGIHYISASFEPLKISLAVDKETLPYKSETDDLIRDFIHLFFVKDRKGFVYCYALVTLKTNDYYNPIGIVKGNPYSTLTKWEYIPLPSGVKGVNLKYIGLLDNRLTLITQEQTTFGKNFYSRIYQYDQFKKSAFNFLSPVALENPGWHTLYETAPKTILSKFSGNSMASWWIYAQREYPDTGNLISHVHQEKSGLKVEKPIDALWITQTPDNAYRWTIEPQTDNASQLTLLIEDLEDKDEFKEATLVNLMNTMPRQIKNLLAFDDTKAYCIDNLGVLYEIDNQGNVTSIATNIGSIDAIAYLNNQLAVTHGNNLYLYKPKAQQLITKKAITPPISSPMPEKTNAPQPNVLSTSSPKQSDSIIAQPKEREKSVIAEIPAEQLVLIKKQKIAAPTQPTETQPSKTIEFQDPSARIRFTQPQQSYLIRLYKSPQFQSILKRTVGNNTLYNKFLKPRTAPEFEQDALAKDPRPWEKFALKPTRYENAQYWLFKKTGGWLGSDTAEQYPDEPIYDFPTTREGRRAKLLYALSTNNPHYISQWLNQTEWNKLDITAKARLKLANGGTLPEFKEFWLQERIQNAIKDSPYSVKSLFGDEE